MYTGAVARRRKGEPEPEPRMSTHVYIPASLYEAVAEGAQAEGRSINAEIIQALKAWVSERSDRLRFSLVS